MSLLTNPEHDTTLLDAVARRCYVSSASPASPHYFDVTADVISRSPHHHFAFHQVLWMGLVNLGRNADNVRCQAFHMLEVTNSTLYASDTLTRYNSAVRSSATNVYLHAQRQISSSLAASHPEEAIAVLSQATLRLPQARDGQEHLALQCLEPWVARIVIMSEDGILTPDGYGALHNMFSLTVRYGDAHPDPIQTLWTTLVAGDAINNANAVIKFLIEQATVRANPSFIAHARKVVAYMSLTTVGPQVFVDLCSIIEPSAMVPQEPSASSPVGNEDYFVEDLDALLPIPKARQQLYAGEIALLLLGDATPSRPWDHDDQLPVLIHALFCQLDHRLLNVRAQIRRMFFQILRCWASGYEQLIDNSSLVSRSAATKFIDDMEADPDIFWASSPRGVEDTTTKMKKLCQSVTSILLPSIPSLVQEWAELALQWGTRCPVREMACRSFQLFRALSPDVQPYMLAGMMDRLSNMVSDPSPANQTFAKEILLTLIEMPKLAYLRKTSLPQLFWCASACLSTSVEKEFLLAVDMMDAVIQAIELDDPSLLEVLRSQRPANWSDGDLCIDRLVFAGLRSSVTYDASFSLLTKLARVDGDQVVGASESRLRHFYTICLPWCLHAIEDGVIDGRITSLAQDVAAIAHADGVADVARLMTSFAGNKFKRKEDFIKQAVSLLKESFATTHATETLVILLGLVRNQEGWLRAKSLMVLKLLCQRVDARKPLNLSGSDLLVPLLELLDTDLASQALEVLDTPMTISGGPNASRVLRMSVYGLAPEDVRGGDLVFGPRSESGWCVANEEEQAMLCRRNVAAVFSTCQTDEAQPHRSLSAVFFATEDGRNARSDPEIIVHESHPSSDNASLGEMVNTLHDLNTFFQSDEQGLPGAKLPNVHAAEEAERRVAAILSRSLARPTNDRGDPALMPDGGYYHPEAPATPFIGLFATPTPFTPVDTLHQNFMAMGEDSDGEDGDHHLHQSSYFQGALHRSTSSHNGNHPAEPSWHGYRDDSDSEDEPMNSFSLEDGSADQSLSLRRRKSTRVRELLSSRLSPKNNQSRRG